MCFESSGSIPFIARACAAYRAAESKSPVSAYAAASVSIMFSSFHAMMLQAALASLTACRPLRNDWVWASRLKPRTVAQRPGKSNSPRMDRDEIIKLLQCFRIFAKVRIDRGSQQCGLNKARILPERFIAILNSKIVFAFPCKNLRADVQRRPKRGISVKRRIQIALCTGNIAMFQPILCIRNRFMTARRPAPYPTMIGTLALTAVTLAIIAMRSEVILMDIICFD